MALMSKKILYIEFSEPFWIDVASWLHRQYGWQPLYWTGYRETIEQSLRENLPDVTYQTTVDAVKMIVPPQYSEADFPPLDKPILDSLATCELTVLKMMNRMDALGSFSYHERARHYHRTLRYWIFLLDELQPDIVFFKEIPHMVYDYILYELCKVKGIETLMFMISNLRWLWYLMDSIYDESIVMKKYKELLANPPDEIQLSPESEQYLKSFQSTDYKKIPPYVRFVNRADFLPSEEKHWIRKLLDFENYPQYVRKQLEIIQYRLRPPVNYLKEPRKTAEQSEISFLDYQWFNFRAKRKLDRLMKHYNQLAKEPDLRKSYIYVALTYQPEANSSPKGGVYAHTELMIDMLSSLVPSDWHIYVKEHPSQLQYERAFRSQAARWPYFYDDLAKKPNVTLVPISKSPYDLIDHAKAVATLTGTTGFQAVNRGIPALIFGYPFYRGCEGVFHIESTDDCKIALEKIQSDFHIDQDKMRLFVYALEQVSIVEYIEERWKHFFQPSYDSKAMANEIYRYWQHLRAER